MTFETFLKTAQGPFRVYTDGSCLGNPGDGGYGIHVMGADKKHFELSGAEADTTNNRMEMMAAIKALELFASHGYKGTDVTIYTDSQYLKNGILTWIKSWKVKGWKTAQNQPVKNQDLWQRLDEFNTQVKPDWQWVRGHSNDFGNERADALAKNAVVALKIKKA